MRPGDISDSLIDQNSVLVKRNNLICYIFPVPGSCGPDRSRDSAVAVDPGVAYAGEMVGSGPLAWVASKSGL